MSQLVVYTGPSSQTDNQLRTQTSQRSAAYDPVDKLRTSNPQALIDTDFEYGTQPTKWESIGLQQNRQSCYYIAQSPLTITGITGANTLNGGFTLAGSFNLTAGDIIYIQNSLNTNCNGWLYVTTTSTTSVNVQTAGGTTIPATNFFNTAGTYVYKGIFYSSCGIQVAGGTSFSVSGSTVTVTTVGAHGLNASSLIYVVGTGGYTTNPINGAQVVATVPTANTFTYTNAAGTPSTTVTFVTANITASNTTGSFTVATTPLVGLQVNTAVVVTGTNSGTSGLLAGTYLVSATNGTTTFTLTTTTGGVVTTVASGTNTGLTFAPQVGNVAGQSNLFARPAGYVETRSFDGGVAFSAGSAVPNQQLIRQTRRYFRYQSGKGLQFSTGSALKPALFNPSLSASSTAIGATITVTTQFPHNLTAGTVVTVAGVDQVGYNGTYTVLSGGLTATTFTYTATTAPASTTATGLNIKVSPFSWYGSSNRIGFFDQQNGIFFEFDGQVLYAVLRSSTTQLNGRATVTQGSGTITGTGTQFSTQVAPNDYIVIRGQSYKVITITSDTSLQVSPEYRGATISQGGAIISKTIDTRVPQSQWFDPCDGTGASGYNLDLTRMQMWYIDYSWYGAGVIRWGFRATGGAIIYVYAQQNNNIKYEAYMRSGNMSAHYESNNQSPTTYLTASMTSGATSMTVADTSNFAPAGTLKIQASGTSGAVEYVTYTSKTSTTFSGLTRGATGGGAASAFTYSATAPVAVEYASPDTAAALSHWGSSVIMDGRFDDDKSLIFNYGSPAKLTTTTSTTQVTPVLAIRIAPSVDNGITGLLGNKEIINRMQLQFVELGIYATGPLLVNLVLNGYVSGAFSSAFQSPLTSGTGAVTSSLAQVATNITNSIGVVGGESVAAAFTNTNGQTTLDLSQVRDLGNSILGGGTSTAVPTSQSNFYPDGPDILYVCVTPLTATAIDVFARLSWKEAQA